MSSTSLRRLPPGVGAGPAEVDVPRARL
jgi:hypothetical protein